MNPDTPVNDWRKIVKKRMDKKYSLFEEEYFRYILQLEVKRSERSKRPFLLLHIDMSRLVQNYNAVQTIKDVISEIFSVTRETDIKGWVRSEEVLGIIFLEYDNESDEIISKKINDSLKELLDPSEYSLISVNSIKFPEDISINGEIDFKKWIQIYNDTAFLRSQEKFPALCKRCIDIAGSLLCILLFSPVFIIASVLIKCTSKGAVFFKQTRMGENGRQFTMLKFRTMEENNNESIHKQFIQEFIHSSSNSDDDDTDRTYKIIDDPRVTKIGKWLRKTSMDEIPQFFNVLLGDMSIVGPRPAIPYEVEEYDIWHKRRMIGVKPGITGFWQVNGRSRTDFNNMVRMDIQYTNHWTPVMDLFLILKTPFSLLSAKGAY